MRRCARGGAVGNAHADASTQPVDRAAGKRDQQKLGLLVNEDRRVALDEVPPNDIVGPTPDRRARMRPRWDSRGRRR